MAVQPFPNAKFQALDSSGNPLSGGKLYTYAAGTTTPLATYTDRAGGTPNANPVILDANGQADVWTTPGVDYKFVLKNSSDVTQWTVDNLPSPPAITALADGTIRVPDGTAGAPGLAFINDTDTGLYRIGANNPAMSAGSTKVQEWSTAGSTFPRGAVVTQSQTDLNGVVTTGNGVAAGLSGTGGGSNGNGVYGLGGNTNGKGVVGEGTGSGVGVQGTGGATNAAGVSGTGGGTGAGVSGTGGSSGTGVTGTGGSTNGKGVVGAGAGTGVGVQGTGGGSNAAGGSFTGGATNGVGVVGQGTGTGAGGTFTGGSGGSGADGLTATAIGTGVAVRATSANNIASAAIYGGGQGDAIGGDFTSQTGYGVRISGDTSSPTTAALRIVPQDANPSGPNLVGDVYVTTAGKLMICTAAGTPGTWTVVGTQT